MIRALWRATSPGERLAMLAFALAIIAQITAVLRGGPILVVMLVGAVGGFLGGWLFSSLHGRRGHDL